MLGVEQLAAHCGLSRARRGPAIMPRMRAGPATKISRHVAVPAELAGQRLDQAAAVLLPEFSRSRLRAWIDAGALTLGGHEAKPRTRLKGGEELALETELACDEAVGPEPIPLTLVHADDALLVIDKPAGLVVHPGAGNRSGTLQNALLHRYPELAVLPRAGLVHRLDKDTSGLLLVARTLASQTALAAALEERAIKRTYRAICQGVLTGGGTIDAPVGRHRRERTKMAVVSGGRPARTHYRVVERFRAHTHCELELETGRTHQIRVHMAHIGAPLLGDPVYGGRPKLPPAPSDELRAALQGFKRQALHASRLRLAHPVTGAELAFESPVPADFAALLALLRADARAA
jgi:23S rRNA pseudouridine1911/1915/1917 synthase